MLVQENLNEIVFFYIEVQVQEDVKQQLILMFSDFLE